MITVIGVRFKKAGKIYYFSPDNLNRKKNTSVIVETARVVEVGEYVIESKQINEEDIVAHLKNDLRIVKEDDRKKFEENKTNEKEAFSI